MRCIAAATAAARRVPQTTPPALLDPGSWNAGSYVGRRDDVKSVLDAIARGRRAARCGRARPHRYRRPFAGRLRCARDDGRMAVVGRHAASCRAALLAVQPAAVVAGRPPQRSRAAHVPRGRARLLRHAFLEGPQGAYASANPPKYFAKLRGGNHFIWTNLQCAGMATVSACLRMRPEAALINRYAIAFLDRHLKDRPQPILEAPSPALSTYVHQP